MQTIGASPHKTITRSGGAGNSASGTAAHKSSVVTALRQQAAGGDLARAGRSLVEAAAAPTGKGLVEDAAAPTGGVSEKAAAPTSLFGIDSKANETTP